ncbi:MAG: flagellar biosynthesis protein FlhA, partial [Methylococcales bacterium]|nr:flagellar biosynthesis protein FlhA [Methylococcales bacterium]
MINNAALSNFWQSFSVPNSSSLVIPSVLFCIIMMMVVPLPPFLLDLFFTFNITLSLVIAMICINALKPLDFSSFPTVLLFATLLRLALNVASTRVILVEGHNGTDSAGTVIQAFGDFIIGGDYFVGIIVFSILMIINFIVITKGAGRVSEVTARFTLDAMPGKQMAIDADLNAGIITKEAAKQRREEVAAESEFYGSMDGASKFVKGDVIAGFIILIINVLGGLVIGTSTHGMTFNDAAHTYVLLTIGDGLVAQIPSLLLSTATAIIITRVSSSSSMHSQLKLQMGDPQPLAVTAGILTILGFIPGMPHFVFLFLAAIAGGIAFYSARSGNYLPSDTSVQGEGGDVEEDEDPKTKELSWDDVPRLDVIGLEVGYALIPLIDQSQGGDLMQ